MNEKWDRHFIGLAEYHSRMSKDPSTKIGAVIVGPDKEVLSAGFNGFPRGIADTEERLNNRDMKLKLVVHAEMNAILAAARTGIKLKGSTLYVIALNRSYRIWGGPPCTRCAVEIIQAGIIEIVSFKPQYRSIPKAWKADLDFSREVLSEAGVLYREVDYERERTAGSSEEV